MLLHKSKLIILLLGILIISGCTNSGGNNTSEDKNISSNNGLNEVHKSVQSKVDPIQAQLNKMTLNEKLGQMIIAGFDGTTMNSNVKNLITKFKVGGIIFFRPNVQNSNQLVSLTNAIKTANINNKIPLFLSVDQEGGRVNRMPTSIENTPTARAIGNTNKKDYAYNIGHVIAKELTAYGFNLDFAPVLDIQSNPKNTVIGDRSFGTNPAIVSTMGLNMMRGISSGKIVTVIKHFPGHGDTSVDSHLELPIVNNDLTRLKNFELIPFSNAIKNGADMVMVAHILVSKVDPKYPASLSKTIITGILRNQLGFKGVVITDDITMGAIAKNYSLKDAAVRAINAGSDIVLVGHGYDNVATVYNSLYVAVKNHTLSEETINKSVYRILALKAKYGINNNKVSPVNVTDLNNQIRNAVSGKETTSTSNLLDKISASSKVGAIFNSPFHVRSNTIYDVRNVWGNENKKDYVAAAHGTYSTYNNRNVVVAYNKGSQLFELRSYDPQLKNLTIYQIKNFFGTPKSDIKTNNNEEIISYTAGSNLLKFVFPLNHQLLTLDHYSIYAPDLAKNNMAQ